MTKRANLLKKISVFTALSLLLTSISIYGSESGIQSENLYSEEISEVSSNDFSEELSNEEVKEVLQNEQEFVEQNVEGVDYAEKQAFFEADNEEDAKRIAESYGGELESFSQGIGVVTFDKSIDEVLEDVSQSGNFEVPIYADSIVELADSAETESYQYSDAENQWHHGKIKDNPVWVSGNSGEGVTVAVIDNGFLSTHEDLTDRIKYTYNFATGSKSVAPVSTKKSHGTHVAGIIAATANSTGGCGVAPKANLMLLQIANSSGKIYSDYIFSAIDYAINNGADVINMSIAYNSISEETKNKLQTYVDKAYNNGCVVVAAAGNYGSSKALYPAALDHVISVANITSAGKLDSSSNYGSTVDICAPGTDIYSCYATSSSAYDKMTGTSMASPVVAGVAALVYSSKASLIADNSSTAADAVINQILDNTDEKTYSYGSRQMKGCVIASKAIFADKNGDMPEEGEDYQDEESESSEENEEEINTPDDSENIEKEQIQAAISSNSPYGENVVSGNSGSVSYSVAYYEHVPYFGKFYKSAEDLGIEFTANGTKIPSSAIKIKVQKPGGANSIMAVTIKKISGSAYKSLWKELKSSLRNSTISVTSYPMTVSGTAISSKKSGSQTGQVMLKLSKDGKTVKKAGAIVRYHTASGKEKTGMIKIPSSSVNYNSDTKTAVITGDFSGSCTVN